MNTTQKTSHLRTNIIIAIGMAIIIISLAWLGYRLADKIIASRVGDQTIQDGSLEQTEPGSNVPDSTEQTSDNPQDSVSASEE